MIRFDIPGPPVGKARARVPRSGHAYTPAKTRQHEGYIRHLAALAMAGKAPLDGPVSVVVSVGVEPPRSWSKRKRADALAGRVLPIARGDIDNYLKSIMDACQGIVYRDDKQVVDVRAIKRYNDPSVTAISVQEYGS